MIDSWPDFFLSFGSMEFGSGITVNSYTIILKRFFRCTPISHTCLTCTWWVCWRISDEIHSSFYYGKMSTGKNFHREKCGIIFQLCKIFISGNMKRSLNFLYLLFSEVFTEYPNSRIEDYWRNERKVGSYRDVFINSVWIVAPLRLQ